MTFCTVYATLPPESSQQMLSKERAFSNARLFKGTPPISSDSLPRPAKFGTVAPLLHLPSVGLEFRANFSEIQEAATVLSPYKQVDTEPLEKWKYRERGAVGRERE